MTMMSGNNRHETFLIVRCSSVGTAVVLLAALVRLSPARLAAAPSRAGNSQVNQASCRMEVQRTKQGRLLSNLQPGIRYCIAWASSRAPKAFFLTRHDVRFG